MGKLTLKDLQLKKAGEYIKDAILQKYNSIDSFANEINRYASSVKSYLRQKECGSHKFKIMLMNKLGKSYDEIVKTKEFQLIQMVDNISSHVDEYNSKDDIIILEKLKDMCMNANLEVEFARMLHIIAMYHNIFNKRQSSIELLKHAISIMKYHKQLNYQIIAMSDLGLLYYLEHEYEKAKQVFFETEKYIDVVNNKDRFFIFYRFGIVLNNIGLCTLAREKFNKSLEYADTKYDMANSVMNIGLTHKRENNIEKALDRYYMCLSLFEDKLDLCHVYNNLAEAFRCINEHASALEYIEKALNIENEFSSLNPIHVQTYIQIKLVTGSASEAIEKLALLLYEYKEGLKDTKYLKIGLTTMVDYCNDNNDMELLKKVKIMLVELIEENKYQGLNNELKTILYDIIVLLDKGSDSKWKRS